MVKEIEFICAFVLSIMIFSSFTPFAYAIKEPVTAELSSQRQVSQNCANDVWFDELDWNEYQNLIGQTVKQIDGFGDKNLQAEEAALAKSGVGTNADAINSKHIFLPGADGKPALLYDVMKNKAVDPSSVCHLNNLFSSGRVAYAARLYDNIRYCPTESTGRQSCETSYTSKQVGDIIGQAIKINDTTLENLDDKQFTDLEKIPPNAVFETKEASFTLNADSNLFFPKTITDFVWFIRSLNFLDVIIATGNAFSMIRVTHQAAKTVGLGEKLSSIGGKLKQGVSGALWRTDKIKEIGAGTLITKGQEGLAELKAGSDLLDEKVAAEATTNLYNIQNGVANELSDATQADVLIRAKDLVGVKIPEGTPFKDALFKIVEAFKAKGLEFSRIGTEPAVTALKATDDVSKALAALEAVKTGAAAVNAGKAYEAIQVVKGYKSAEISENVFQIAKTTTLSKWERLQQIFNLAFTKSNGIFNVKKAFLAAQVTQSLFMGTLFVRNNILKNPEFNAQGIIEFYLSNDISNYVSKQDKTHYLDIQKTAGIPHMGDFVTSIFDNILQTGAGTERKQLNEIQTKLKSIQDIVFILDQDALLTGNTNSKATNVIVPGTDNDKWFFFSSFPDRTLAYNFEHPNGYTPRGNSALFLSLRNINIYGVSGLPDNWFSEPLTDSVLPILNAARDLTALGTFFGVLTTGAQITIPNIARLGTLGKGFGAGIAAIITVPLGYILMRQTIDRSELGWAQLTDVQRADPQYSCENKFTGSNKFEIGVLKGMRTFFAWGSFVTAGAKASPGIVVGILFDIGQYLTGYIEADKINSITNDLQNCVDTSFDVISLKSIPDPATLLNQSNDLLSPIKADAMKIFNILSPDIGAQFDSLASTVKMQVMHVQVQAEDNPLTSVVGKEVYNVHFKDANIQWFQKAGCNIDLCQLQGSGYKCITQDGYRIIDESGNALLDGVPQAASLRMNMEEGYMGIVQRAIEIKKTDGELLDISSDGVTISNDCIKNSVVNLTGLSSLSSSTRDKAISDLFGGLEAVYTPEAQIWFDGNDVATQFLAEKTCTDGTTHGAREIFRYPGAQIKVYRDAAGKVEIVGNDSQVKCDFALGTDGAVGFSNALIRSGFVQDKTDKAKAADYSDVYHLFIYSLVTADKSEVSSYSTNACLLPDGTKGIRPFVVMDDPAQATQWNTILAGMCMADVLGTGNSSVHFNDSMVYVTDPTGASKAYHIIGYDQTCGNGNGGYKVSDENGEESCLFMEKGPDGQPQVRADAQAPVPLLWANGLGGSFMYDPNSGKISIKNEFPFAINPSFGIYGAGGLGMMTPTLPPWGGHATGTGETANTAVNPLAALPWMPNGIELALFAMALAGSLLFIRIRYKREKDT